MGAAESSASPFSMEVRVDRAGTDVPSTARVRPHPSPRSASIDLERPTRDELLVMKLLATGLTDEVAASRLGWTRRTFRRRLKGAMDKLGAVSRLQAGYMYASSGWIIPDEPSDS